MEIKNFRKLISMIQQHPRFLQSLPIIEQNYLVKIYKIGELTATSVIELYGIMQRKFYLNRKSSNQEAWYENQLRIFIWLLFGYLYVFQKNIKELNEEDWKFFSPLFNFKSTVFFEFQSLSLLRPSGKAILWTQEQTSLLQIIISQKNSKNRWNSIARQLYIRSGKKFFRNPKQCRERWMNHLDPSKIHTEWSAFEDLVLLNCIKNKGKKWSVAMKELSNTRTEHMVKNRYKSLISNEAKRYPGKREFEIENILIKKLSKLQEKQFIEQKSEHLEVQSEERISNKSREEKKQKRQDNQDLMFLSEFKNPMKEEVIKEQPSNIDYNFLEHLGNDFNEGGVNRSLFIPWFSDNDHLPFDLSEVKENSVQFGGMIKLDDSDELQI